MIRKLTAVLSASAIALFCAVGFSACDKDVEVEEKEKIGITNSYVDGDGGLILVLTDGSEYNAGKTNELEIPSIIDNRIVTSIADGAFGGCGITSVVIPDSVQTIGEKAFYECSALEAVTVGNGVVYSGEYAFGRCGNLKSVYINSIKDWCEIEFGNASANPLYFAGQFYLDGSFVTDMVIPDGTALIGDYAFYGCTTLKSVTMCDSVASIGQEAFYECAQLESVTFGNGVKSIGDCAFQDCAELRELTLGSALETVGNYAFFRCYSLGEMTIPSSVCDIGEYAFADCIALAQINLNFGLQTIGDCAFAGCTALKALAMPDSVTHIGFGVLMFSQGGWTGGQISNELSELVISNSLGEIPDFAFNGCNITNLVIGDSVQTIKYSSFYACSMLQSVVIPVSVKKIESYSFYRCPSLQYVFYKGTAEQWAGVSVGKNGNEFSTICYYSETQPSSAGNFWHYADGVPELW